MNEQLIAEGKEPIAFDHDCREGICGSCAMMINGQAHGPERGTATCQLHMRKFADGDDITVEPWRAAAFPIIQDLCVDRAAFDRIIEAGGYITAPTGSAPDANLIPVPKAVSRRGDGRGGLHRLRRLRGRVPERRRAAVHGGEARSTSTCCPRASPSAASGSCTWWTTMERCFGSCTQPRRVRGGVPEGDLDRLHRAR